MIDVKITKTPFERAEPVGRELLKKATAEKEYRKNWVDKEIGQASKEIANHLAGLARGRVSVTIDPIAWQRIFGKEKNNVA